MEQTIRRDSYLGSSFHVASHVIFMAISRSLVRKEKIEPKSVLHSGVVAATTTEVDPNSKTNLILV
jgi:hypothetical protein